MESSDIKFDDLCLGDMASFGHTISQEESDTFARLSGDMSPLHTSEAFAAKTQFKHTLVHGMLLGAFCSQLVGMHLPGRRCLDLRQDLSFKKPVYVGDTIKIMGVLTHKSISTRVLTITIQITQQTGDVVLDGIAYVQMLPDDVI